MALMPSVQTAAGVVSSPSGGFAVPTAVPAASAALSGMLQTIVALLLVLALIFALAWFARRLKLGGGGNARMLRIIEELPLGPKERVVLVAVGDSQWLVGVASGQVSAPQRLEVPIALAAESISRLTAPSFRDVLRRSLGR